MVASVCLGYGIGRSDVAAPYSDPVSRLRAQDESTYANSAAGLVGNGGWLTPKFMGRFLLYKPPLFVWLTAFSEKIFGISVVALRLPALLAGIFATVAVFWWMRGAASLAAAIAVMVLLLSDPLWQTFARLCYTDMLLAASMVGAMAVIYIDPRLATIRALLLFSVLIATGVMVKNVAGLLAFGMLLLYWALARAECRPALMRIAFAGAIAGLLVAPWHIYQFVVHRQWFWADYVQVQLLNFGVAPPAQTNTETQAVFYIKRLFLIDGVLIVLLLLALPSLLRALRRRDQVLPALLISWLLIASGALLAFRYRNLPYALYVVPPAAMIAVLYGPFFRPRRVNWAMAALCALFVVKACFPGETWGLSFGGSKPLGSAAALRTYAAMHRPNELIIADPNDEFYSSTLFLPRVRYYYADLSGMARRYSSHYAFLGISLTEDEFERLGQLRPVYEERLRSWGLDSDDPIGTVIIGDSEVALARLIALHPQSDFFVNLKDVPKTGNSHGVVPADGGRVFLLAQPSTTAEWECPCPNSPMLWSTLKRCAAGFSAGS